VLRRRLLLLLALPAALVAGTSFGQRDSAPDPHQVAELIIVLANEFRTQQGRGKVEVNARLTEAARHFAEYMAKTGQLSHGADGSNPATRAKRNGYDYCIVSENIAYKYSSAGFATRELARELGLKTGAPLIRIESVRLADRTPICVSTSWLSAERFPGAGDVFASVRSMTKLVAHYGVRDFRRSSTKISAAIADATDAARLDLALGRPVLVVDSTDVDTVGKPIVTKRSRFAAERVEFLVENS